MNCQSSLYAIQHSSEQVDASEVDRHAYNTRVTRALLLIQRITLTTNGILFIRCCSVKWVFAQGNPCDSLATAHQTA